VVAGYATADRNAAQAAAAPDGPTLREAAEARGLLIGAAVNGAALTGDGVEQAFYDTLGTQFNSVVAENEMKFEAIHPERDRYDFPLVVDVLAPSITREQVAPSRWYVSAND